MSDKSFSNYVSKHSLDAPLIFYVVGSVLSTYVFTEYSFNTQNKYIFLGISLYIIQIAYQWLAS